MGEMRERVTVAFSLEALGQLRNPALVFGETAGWAGSVGIVSDRPMYAQTAFAREHGLDYGFLSGSRDLLDSLRVIRARPEQDADRYLLIGAALEASEISTTGWEVLSIEDAAAATGWELGDPGDDIDEEDRGWP